MALLGGKEDNKGVDDTLKILSTSIEVLNQKLASSMPEYGGEGGATSFLEEKFTRLEKQMDDLQKQVDISNSHTEVLQRDLAQGFANSLKSINSMLNQKSQSIIGHVSAENQELFNSTAAISKELQRQNAMVGAVVKDLSVVKAGLTQSIEAMQSNLISAVQTMKSSGGADKEIEQEIKTDLDKFYKEISEEIESKGKLTPGISKKLEKFNEQVIGKLDALTVSVGAGPSAQTLESIDEISRIQTNLNEKLDEMKDIMKIFVNVHKEWLTYFKDAGTAPDLEKLEEEIEK